MPIGLEVSTGQEHLKMAEPGALGLLYSHHTTLPQKASWAKPELLQPQSTALYMCVFF